MDTVRFGRVLGQGARQAAKTLVSAVDAATAPDPRQTQPPSTPRPAHPATPPTDQAAPRISAQPASLPSSPPPPQASLRSTPTFLPPATPPRPSPRASAATTTRGLAEGSRRFGRAVWAPAVRLSGVLWLELTGVFFALFALVAAIATWRLRSALPILSTSTGTAASSVTASDDRTRLLFAAGMVLVFGYFSLSSFLKASRRSRQS